MGAKGRSLGPSDLDLLATYLDKRMFGRRKKPAERGNTSNVTFTSLESDIEITPEKKLQFEWKVLLFGEIVNYQQNVHKQPRNSDQQSLHT